MISVKNRTSRGFTIVELLIVIIVIAILASITIVAYNGIRDRAENTSRLSEVVFWERQIDLYLAENGRLPFVSGMAINNTYCLGNGFINVSGDAQPDCRGIYDAAQPDRGAPNANLHTALAKYNPTPTIKYNFRTAGEGMVGPFLYVYKDGGPTAAAADDRLVMTVNHAFINGCPTGYVSWYSYQRAHFCEKEYADLASVYGV